MMSMTFYGYLYLAILQVIKIFFFEKFRGLKYFKVRLESRRPLQKTDSSRTTTSSPLFPIEFSQLDPDYQHRVLYNSKVCTSFNSVFTREILINHFLLALGQALSNGRLRRVQSLAG